MISTFLPFTGFSWGGSIHLEWLTPYFKASIVLMLEEKHAQEDRRKWYLKMKFKILLQITSLAFDILTFFLVCMSQNFVPRIQKSWFLYWLAICWLARHPTTHFFYTVPKTKVMVMILAIWWGFIRPALPNRHIMQAICNLNIFSRHVKKWKEISEINFSNIFSPILPKDYHFDINNIKVINDTFYIRFCTKSLRSGMYLILIAHVSLD